MKDDYTVNIVFRNKNMEPVGSKDYGLQEYCMILKDQLMRVIMDVEDVFYNIENCNRKEEWSEEHLVRFKHLRHKILDAANSIDRIPDNLCYKGKNINTMTAGEFIRMIVDKDE